jgi:hypothetical protein
MLEPHLRDAFDLFIAVVAAALISAGLIVVLRPLLQRYALARPNARSSHKLPTPQGAGIAVIAATVLVTMVWQAINGLAFPLILAAAVLLIAVVGLVDDIRPIPVLPRLLFQTAAIGAILATLPADLRIATALPIALERGAILIAGLWFVNLVNFMDGLDLMTVAEMVPITATLTLLGWLGELPVLPTLGCERALRRPARLFALQPPGCKSFPRRCRQPADRPLARLVPAGARLPASSDRRAAVAAVLPRRCDADADAPHGEARAVLGGAPHPLLPARDRQRSCCHAGRRPGLRAELRARGACHRFHSA